MSLGLLVIALLGTSALVGTYFFLGDLGAPIAAAPGERVVPVRQVWPKVAITLVGFTACTMIRPLIACVLPNRFRLPGDMAVGWTGFILAGASLGITLSLAAVTIRLGWIVVLLLQFGSMGCRGPRWSDPHFESSCTKARPGPENRGVLALAAEADVPNANF